MRVRVRVRACARACVRVRVCVCVCAPLVGGHFIVSAPGHQEPLTSKVCTSTTDIKRKRASAVPRGSVSEQLDSRSKQLN